MFSNLAMTTFLSKYVLTVNQVQKCLLVVVCQP